MKQRAWMVYMADDNMPGDDDIPSGGGGGGGDSDKDKK